MSTVVDQKVVEMRFDNRHFESNVQTSMSTLDKLKQKLNLSGASKGLENLGTTANKVNMNGLSNALDTVHSKFSAMEIVGITALANITNSAVNAGKRIVSALTIDPVRSGFSEYEQKVDAVRTIMASTGKDIGTVNKYLAELNEYSDRTIYRFSDMTQNIGKFTNAGVKLEDAVIAMKGISNAAALSGANTNEAARAMYNLSQALSMGYVQLIDWKSIENANMATVEFKTQLLKTAVAMGTVKKTANGMYKTGNKTLSMQAMFKDGLQEQWLTSKVLISTLKDYGDMSTAIGKKAYAAAQDVTKLTQMWDVLKETAQSGWARTWEIILGDYDQAKAIFTPLTKFFGGIIDKIDTARNSLLGGIFSKDYNNPFISVFEKISNSKILKTADKVNDKIKGISKSLGYYQKMVNKVWRGDYKNQPYRFGLLEKEGHNPRVIQDLVNKGYRYKLTVDDVRKAEKKYGIVSKETTVNVKKTKEAYDKLSDATLKKIGLNESEIRTYRQLERESKRTGKSMDEIIEKMKKTSGRDLLINSFKNIGNSLVKIFSSIGKAWSDVFDGTSVFRIYSALESFSEFTKKLVMSDKTAKNLTRTLRGVFSILGFITDILGGGLKIAFTILKTILFTVMDVLGISVSELLEYTAKIGDAIYNTRKWLKENSLLVQVVRNVTIWTVKAVKAVADWITHNKTLIRLFETFKTKLNSLSKGIRTWFEGIKEADNIPKYIFEGLVNGLKYGVTAIFNIVTDIGKGIIDAICKVLGIHSPSRKFFEIGQNIIQGLVNGLKTGTSVLFEIIKGIGSKCYEIFKKVDIGKLIALGIGISMLVIFNKLLNTINNVIEPIRSFSDMMKDFGNAAINVSKGIKAKLVGEAIKNIAISIAILAASILILSKIDAPSLWKAVGAIVVLTAVIGGLALAASKSDKLGDFGKSSLSIIAIAGSLVLIAIAMKKLASIEANQMKVAINGLLAVVISFSALMIVMGKVFKDPKTMENVHRAGSMILKISFALLLMVGVIKLASMLKPDTLKRGISTVALFVTLIAGILVISKFSSASASKAGSMILKITFALLMMIGVVKLAAMLSENEIQKGLSVITGIGKIFALLIATSYLAGKNATKAGTMILAMSIALLVTVSTIKLIASINNDEIAKGLTVVTVIGVIFAGLIAVSKLAGANALKAGTMILMLSGALILLTGVIFLLSKMNTDGLYRAVGIIAVLEILFGGLIFITKYAGKGNSFKTILTLLGSVALLIAAVIGLSFVDPKRLLSSVTAISAIMISLGILLAATSKMKNSKNAWKTLVPLLGVVAALSIVITALSKINPKSSISSAAALSTLLLSLTGALAIISAIKTSSLKGIGALALLGLVVGELAVVLGLMSHFNVKNAIENVKALSTLLLVMSGVLVVLSVVGLMGTAAYIGVGAIALLGLVIGELAVILGLMSHFNVTPSMETVKALSVLLLAMSGVLVILGVVGLMGPAAFIGVGALATLIIAIGGLAVAIGALMTKFPDLQKFLDAGIPVLTQIAGGIGEMIGAFVKGALTKMSESLPVIGTNLSLFMKNANGFITGAKSIDKKVVEGVSCLSKAIVFLTAADLINGVASFLSGGVSFSELGTELSAFMRNCSGFLEASANIDPKAMDGVKKLSEALIIITGADLLQNISGWLSGESSLSDFGEQIGLLGTSLQTFITNLGPFGEDQIKTVDCAGKAVKALADSAKQLPKEGGLWQSLFGEQSLSAFASHLPALGLHLKTFIANLGSFGEDQIKTVDCAGKAVKALADSAKQLPKEGGVWQALAGDQSLSAFASHLPALGLHLNTFVNNLGTFGDDQVRTVDCAGRAIKALADAADKLPPQDGLWQKLVGDKSLSKFADKLPALGEDLKEFMAAIGEFSPKSVDTVNSATAAMLAISNLGLIDMKETGKNLAGFGDKMIAFAGKIKTFLTNMSGIETGDLSASITKMKELVKIAASIAQTDVSALDSFGKSLANIGTKAITEFVNSFAGPLPIVKIRMSMVVLMTAVSDAAKKNQKLVTSGFKTVADAAIDTLTSETYKEDVTQAGKDFTTGFADGIKANKYLAVSAGSSIGKAALKAAKEAIDSNSPSKETYKLGTFFDQGFVLGIKSLASKVYNTAHDVGDKAKTGLSSAVSKISDAINSDIDAQPTIRPVLDLSDVESGAGYLNSMFNNGQTIGVMSNLRAISSGMSNRNQNGTNTDIVTAIDNLRKDLGNVGGDTYNVNGITYDDGSNITDAVRTLVRAVNVGRRT